MTKNAGAHRLVGMMTVVEESEYVELISRLSFSELGILLRLEVGDYGRLRSRLHNSFGHRTGVRSRIDNDVEVRKCARKRELIEDRMEELVAAMKSSARTGRG